jgi:phage tail-like protein
MFDHLNVYYMPSNNFLPVSFHFKVQFQGVGDPDVDIRFQEVGGLTAEIGTEDLPVGGENRFTYRLPTRPKYGNLILKRALLTDSKLIDWFRQAVENFSFQPADAQVFLLDEQHQTLASWSFVQTYPVKWVISDLRAQENALAVETIELAYQYYRRV